MKVLFFLTCSLFVFLGACSRDSGSDSDSPLRVGMELAYPPFETKNEEGKPSGISVELAQALAERLGRPLAIEDIRFDGLIPALKSGKIDCILSSMTKTEKRSRSVDFSDSYVSNSLCLLTQKSEAELTWESLDQPGNHVAVKRGTTGHEFARTQLKQAKLTVLDLPENCVSEVLQGKANAFVYDQISVYRYWKKHPDRLAPNFQPIKKETWAIAVRKGNGQLLEKINTALQAFKAEGKFTPLAQKYLSDEMAAFEERGVPFLFD